MKVYKLKNRSDLAKIKRILLGMVFYRTVGNDLLVKLSSKQVSMVQKELKDVVLIETDIAD